MEYNKEIFANNLRTYMDRDKRTQSDVMRITGASQSAVSDWLNARKFPRVDKIEMLANYFCITKSDLIEDKTQQTQSEKYTRMINAKPKLGDLLDHAYRLSDEDLHTLLNIAMRFRNYK